MGIETFFTTLVNQNPLRNQLERKKFYLSEGIKTFKEAEIIIDQDYYQKINEYYQQISSLNYQIKQNISPETYDILEQKKSEIQKQIEQETKFWLPFLNRLESLDQMIQQLHEDIEMIENELDMAKNNSSRFSKGA